MKKGIMTVMSVIFIFGFIGCVSYEHIQAVRNEVGYTVTEVYIRDTGATNWGEAKNVKARRNSDGSVVYRYDGSVVWDTYNINNMAQVVFFSVSNNSETPTAIGNKDIAIKDSNGLLYMKTNVPITFTTIKQKDYILINGPSETLSTATPITFTAQDRLPMLIVVNQTGYPLTLISPVKNSISNNGKTQFQPMEMNRSIDVTYSIGQAQYTEQVTMKNQDATVTLTKRPPNITIVNNTGFTINLVQIRMPVETTWVGTNILNLQLNADGTLAQTQAGTQSTERRGSVPNKDSFKFWTGNVSISGNVFDIRIDDVQGNAYIKNKVQVGNNDLTLTFTQADKR